MDQSASRLPHEWFAGEPRVHLIHPHTPVEWGGFSQVEALLRSFRWILAELEFDWVCFLSGQDYPLTPLVHVESYLAACDHDALIEPPRPVVPFRGDWLAPEGDAVRRYYYRYLRRRGVIARLLPGYALRALRSAATRVPPLPPLVIYPLPRDLGLRVGFRRLRTPFTDEFRCLKGSELATFSRRAIEALPRRG